MFMFQVLVVSLYSIIQYSVGVASLLDSKLSMKRFHIASSEERANIREGEGVFASGICQRVKIVLLDKRNVQMCARVQPIIHEPPPTSRELVVVPTTAIDPCHLLDVQGRPRAHVVQKHSCTIRQSFGCHLQS